MSDNNYNNERIVRGKIIPVYLDLGGESFGFYRVRPGKDPYICLATELLNMPQGVHLTVYQTLLNYHKAIPADSCYRLFEMVRYYEELIPAAPAREQEEGAVEAELPLNILPFRPARRWQYNIFYPHDYRTIGKTPR